MSTQYNLRFEYASNAAFRERVQTSMLIKAQVIAAEALDVAHPAKSQKRWILANQVLASPASYIDRFAGAVINYPGSNVGLALDSQWGNNHNITPDLVDPAGYNDADVDANVMAVWNNIAGVFPTD